MCIFQIWLFYTGFKITTSLVLWIRCILLSALRMILGVTCEQVVTSYTTEKHLTFIFFCYLLNPLPPISLKGGCTLLSRNASLYNANFIWLVAENTVRRKFFLGGQLSSLEFCFPKEKLLGWLRVRMTVSDAKSLWTTGNIHCGILDFLEQDLEFLDIFQSFYKQTP